MLVFGIFVANAQTSNGTIIGAVTDGTGGAIVGATITITSVDNGAVRTTTTNQDGTYRVESMLAGVYNISASAAGFETTVKTGLQLPGSAIITASLELKVGKTSDRVEVIADNSVINTDNGQLSGTIGELEISSLPIASLNPYELALTLPGVINTQAGGFSNGVDFNVGGGRPRANNFLIEGQDNNDAGIQGQGLQPGNDEAVKEVTIIENAYTAEYGHGAGSVSNLIYKSGTNQFHGAVYERLQNSSLDAIDHNDHFFKVNTRAKYRENLPGFRIGGPVLKNKVFGFASYQWDFNRQSANLDNLTLPTADGLAVLQQYSSNPRVANLIKSFGGLVGVLDPRCPDPNLDCPTAIPLGPDPVTFADRGTVVMGLVKRNLGAAFDAPELDLKGDYIASERDTVTLRYIRTRFTAPFDVFNAPGQLPGFDSDQDGTSHNAGIVETHVFSPRVVNEFRVSYGRIGFTFGWPASTLANPLYNQPSVGVAGMTGYGAFSFGVPQGRFHSTYQLQDTISWTKGKHFLKIGTDLSDTRVKDEVPFNFYGTIAFNDDRNQTTVNGQSVKYHGLANLMDDFGGTSAQVAQQFGSPISQPRLFSQNYFAQDTYRPIPTLSLDLGFRYEYNGAPFNAVGTPYPAIDVTQIACFPLDPGATCHNKQLPDKDQWGPRAGIAWSPTLLGQHKTVIRSGFGVFYDVIFTNIIDNSQAAAPNAASPVITSSTSANGGRGNANWFEQFANLNKNPRASNTSDPIAQHLLSPRTMHWNLNIEQELPWATTFQVGYVGERGEHLYGNTNLNPFVGQYEFGGLRVVPNRGQIILRDNSGDSEYTGLWSEVDHKFNHDFLFRASFTLGKAMDDVSEIFTFNNSSSYQFSQYPTPRGTTDWGPSAYDVRKRLVLSYIWSPRVWHTEGGMKIIGNVVNHWAIAGVTQLQSGNTENVENGFDVDGDGIGNDRPILSNKKAPLTTYAVDNGWFTGVSDGSLCSGPSFFTTNDDCHPVSADSVHWIVPSFDVHPAHPIGRNSMVSPGFQQWDINIQRSFKVTERVTFDFRGELFNAFNHGNFGIENTSLGSGIPSDSFNPDNGSNDFANPYPTVAGHRHARLYARIWF